MKKTLLVIAALSAALYSSAFSVANRTKLNPASRPDITSVEVPTELQNKPLYVSPRAETTADEVYYTLAGDPQRALGFNNQNPGTQLAMAFQIEPSFLSALTDGEITSVSFYTGVESGESINKIPKATVFIASALDGKYLYTQETTLPTTPFTKVDVALDEPLAIPSGSKIYVGVYFNVNSTNNVPIVVDYMGHTNTRGGWVASRASSLASWTWDNISSQFGFVTLGCTIRSSSLPKNTVAVSAVDGQPVAAVNQAFPFEFLLQNNGVNEINKLTIEFGIEGEDTAVEDFVLDRPWGINQTLVGSISEFVAKKATKSSPVTVKVTAIDGVANTSTQSSGSYDVTIVPEGSNLPRNVVIEEFTSISCVYCPVGYTAMEKIHDEHTDGSIIPVCIHVNSPGRDPMTAASYNSVFNNFCTDGVPNSTINRTYSVYPYYEDLIEMAEAVKTLPGVAFVDGEATLDKETRKLTINTKTSFAFDYTDGNSNFILSYGITEDELGPYSQKNGYAGATVAVPGDWQNQPSAVNLVYNDVARQLDKYSGITGSIPAEIKAGEIYDFTHEMTVLQAVDLDKFNVVVYLVNRKTGAIENACKLKSRGDGSFSAIEDVTDDIESSDAPVEYYNLQGIRVTNPEGGIFIRRQGNKVSKVLVR